MRFKERVPRHATVFGFLCGFVENKIDKTANGLNGNCIVHYGGDHSMYTMMVKLENGKREGDAMMLKGDIPFLKLEYTNGVLTGNIARMNDAGSIDLRGRLIDGVESGIFQEYDGAKVTWRGYYRNGKRFSEVVRSEEMEDYYNERDVMNGELLCVSQYVQPSNTTQRMENESRKNTVPQDPNDVFHVDESTPLFEATTNEYTKLNCRWMTTDYDTNRMKRNGMCFELENGRVARVCLYEEGQFQRVITAFHGTIMTEFDANNEITYEGGFKGDMKSGYMREGEGKEYVRTLISGYGLCPNYIETTIRIGHWMNGKKSGVFFELDERNNMKRKCVYENDLVCHVPIVFSAFLMTEYDTNNRRRYDGYFKGDWKTGFLRDGKGKEYGEDGDTPIYFGDFKNGVREGVGEELCGISRKYVGEWKNGKRHGCGREIDWNGNTINYGLWVEGHYQKESVILPLLTTNPSQVQQLVIGNHQFNDSNMIVLKLNDFCQLRHFVVGDDSFGYVRFLEMMGLHELESIAIGRMCFTVAKDWLTIWKKDEEDGACRIGSCPKLQSIVIGDCSFADYYGLQLDSVPSLQSIRLGVVCFYHAPQFSLTRSTLYMDSVCRSSQFGVRDSP